MTATPPRPLRVALLGSRGVPGRYGGYETLMEELAGRLVERGFEVTVYGRRHVVPRGVESYRGARIVALPTVRTKHLDTPVHTALSCLHALRARYDAVLLVNSANALFVPLLRAAGTPVALHVDGIEKRRAKWGRFGRAVYALSERLAAFLPDALVTDAETIRAHYLERYGADSELITYGTAPPPERTGESPTLARLGLTAHRYFLYVSRFEPENNPHRVAAAYREVSGDLPLVMLGGAPYADAFIRSFTAGADRRILFPGAIYGEGYRELLFHALAYIHSTDVGGTHPALVEAMGYGSALFVHRTPENEEVAGDTAVYFDAARPATLAAALERFLEDPEAETVARRRRGAAERAGERFSWEEIAGRYAALFRRLAGHPTPTKWPKAP